MTTTTAPTRTDAPVLSDEALRIAIARGGVPLSCADLRLPDWYAAGAIEPGDTAWRLNTRWVPRQMSAADRDFVAADQQYVRSVDR